MCFKLRRASEFAEVSREASDGGCGVIPIQANCWVTPMITWESTDNSLVGTQGRIEGICGW